VNWALAHSLQTYPKHHAVRLIMQTVSVIPSKTRNDILSALIFITPGFDISRSPKTGTKFELRLFIFSYILTLFFSLILIGIFAFFDNVLIGRDPHQIYFLADKSHLLLCTVIVPSYVSFCILIIYFSLEARSQLKSSELYVTNNFGASDRLRFPAACAVIFLLSSLLTINYINEITAASVGKPIYWFFSQDDNGQVSFNNLGIYYIIANFTAMSLILFSSMFFVATFIDSVLFARSLAQKHKENKLPRIDHLRRSLDAFQKTCLYTKLLIVVLSVNIIVWHNLHYGDGYNLYASMVTITIAGMFLISLPRLHIEVVWAELKCNSQSLSDINIEDLRPHNVKVSTRVADIVLFSLIIIVIWGLDSPTRLMIDGLFF
jgi:hypothetical protein